MILRDIIANLDSSHYTSTQLTKHDVVRVRGLGIGETAVQLCFIDAPLVCLCEDIATATNLSEALVSLGKRVAVLDLPNSPYASFVYSGRKALFELIRALVDFASGNLDVICTTVDMYLYPLPTQEELLSRVLTLSTDKDVDFSNMATTLVDMGYTRVEQVDDEGEFALRGDILDIFPIGEDNIVRVNFWGDTIENIYHLEQTTMSRLDDIKTLTICPASLIKMSQQERATMMSKIDHLISQNKDINTYLNLSRDLELGSKHIDTNIVSALTDHEMCNITTFSKSAVQVSFHEFSIKMKEKKLVAELDTKCHSWLGEDRKQTAVSQGKKVIFDNIESKDESHVMHCAVISNYLTRFDELLKLAQQYIALKRQVVFCLKTKETQNSIAEILSQRQIPYSMDKMDAHLVLLISDFPQNIAFSDEKIVIIGAQNFAYKRNLSKKTSSASVYLPKKGEYVVHDVHGIGYCEGVETIETLGARKDYFRIKYRDDAILYVPCENCDSLSLYMSSANGEVKLNKIGGQEFSQATKRAMKSIKEMAKDLIILYSARAHQTRKPYVKDDYLYSQFESAFAYEETPDQMAAIVDVERDMHSTKIMDRLICGDVGFGKTEVAFRAVFRAVLDGRQVAILAPTTVLSLQHYNSALERFKDFGIRIEMLNRFKTKQEVKDILDDLAAGKVNVICGTHRLLSKDVVFQNLGLLVLDEEQRFGVTAKEHIKQLKNNVDVLTLSATPIPRTLNMALMRIRDISILNTPPVDRKSVKTYVTQFDIDLVKDAILREHERGGQTLIVCNNIDQLYVMASKLRGLLSNVIIDTAHGQMPERALEDAVNRLYERKTEVFLSTTIIENGVDLPHANTMIVLDAQNLGLSQMYQLRGRVGRSGEQAYCFFTYPTDKLLTQEASQRLEAIAEHTELGSGIKLAMRDLQIRGAGELLGKQQSGHIANIGYDMYIKLLERATRELRGQQINEKREIKLDIAISAFIPNDFCISEVERLKIYNSILGISSLAEQKAVCDKLREVYGALPASVVQLTNLALIKSFGEKQGVKHIIINSTRASIEYYEDALDNKAVLHILPSFADFSIKACKLPTISIDTRNHSVQDVQTQVIRWLVNFDKDMAK